MAARKDAARPRRPRAAAPVPLTEAQLDEVRRAVLALSGTGARSLSKLQARHLCTRTRSYRCRSPAAECLLRRYRRRKARRMPRRRGPTACLAHRGSAEAGAASRSAWSGEKLHRCKSGQLNREEAATGQLARSQLRLQAGAPWPRPSCRRAPPPRPRAPRCSWCLRCRRCRTAGLHSSLLDVGRRRRVRGRWWPRSPLRGRPREGLHCSLQLCGRLGKLLARRRNVAARRRGRCRRRDERGRTRAGAAVR